MSAFAPITSESGLGGYHSLPAIPDCDGAQWDPTTANDSLANIVHRGEYVSIHRVNVTTAGGSSASD